MKALSATRLSAVERRFDTVGVTAWAYAVYFLTLCPAYALSREEAVALDQKVGLAIFCVGCATAAWSATRRRRVGYYFCLLFSLYMLLGFPTGTVLGWNMLRALRRNRTQFWPQSPRPAWMRASNQTGGTQARSGG
ncbi:MAG: hypothetical protein QM756_28500 [Polyangiaceae bacterium]